MSGAPPRARARRARDWGSDTSRPTEERAADERTAAPGVALPEAMRAALADFAVHLEVAQGTSAHTVRAYTGDVESLLRHAVRHGASVPRDVDLAALRAWLTTQSERGLARATLARRGAAARAFFDWARRTGRVDSDPAARLASPRVPRTLPTVLAVDAAARMLDAARESAVEGEPAGLREWAAVELLYGAGIRVGELAGVDVDDVDLAQRVVRVLGKGDKERVVPFGVPAARAVTRWLDVGRPPSSPRARARAPAGRPRRTLGQRQVREAVHRLAAAGRRRRRSARPAAQRRDAPPRGGSDLRSVQEILRHSSLATTQRYTHVTAERLRSSFEQAFPRA